MKYLSILIITFCLGVTLYSCKSKEKLSYDKYLGQKIIYGIGGGFTGRVTTFAIFEDGRFFKKSEYSNKFVEYNQIDKNLITQVFNNYKILNLNDLDLNDPGNQYKFLNFQNGDNYKKLKWGGINKIAPSNLQNFYRHLMIIARDHEKSNQ